MSPLTAPTGIELKAHPHMLRHACGYALANKGQDTRAIPRYETIPALPFA
jgi:site-specific recombinase XerD